MPGCLISLSHLPVPETNPKLLILSITTTIDRSSCLSSRGVAQDGVPPALRKQRRETADVKLMLHDPWSYLILHAWHNHKSNLKDQHLLNSKNKAAAYL